MTSVVYAAIYLGALIFVIGCVRRAVQYATTPIHLRWELYPVPHEEPSRAAHGGSYFEDKEWWKKPQRVHRRGELRAMLPEMLFLKGLREFNPRLWVPSFLFHFGLYIAMATAALLVASAGLSRFYPGLVPWLLKLCGVTGYVAAAMVLLGALLLLVHRATDEELKNYTKAGDIFNLLFFIATFAFLAGGYLARPVDSANLSQIVRGLLRFDVSLKIGSALGLGLVLASALAAYIPFTHMAHFIAKYFTYHSVRWDDRVNVRGGSLEARIAQYLTYRPTWAAAHIGADGKKSWADIATTNPAQEVRK